MSCAQLAIQIMKQNEPFIASSMTFWMTICANNSTRPMFICILRKS